MKLTGSCHCGRVRFSVESHAPHPFMRCYCGICRKTAGSGGYGINLSGDSATLEVRGRRYLKVYRVARRKTEHGGRRARGLSPARRHFCGCCGSALWVYDPRWPELVHPFASAVDTPLPTPPETVHIMLDYKPRWLAVPRHGRQKRFGVYPKESIEAWHRRHGLWQGE
ncbi:MAG: GFA family protein [Alphaproteobacteria bacterium]|nr:GFA family protein [Alphaproteobacteria bacterium]